MRAGTNFPIGYIKVYIYKYLERERDIYIKSKRNAERQKDRKTEKQKKTERL